MNSPAPENLPPPSSWPPPPGSALTLRARLFGFAIYVSLFNFLPVVLFPIASVFRSLLPKNGTTFSALFYYLVVVLSCLIALVYVAVKQPAPTPLRDVWLSLLGKRDKLFADILIGSGSYFPVMFFVILASVASSRLFEIVPHPALKEFHNANALNQRLLFLQATVFAPIIEETIFRGLLFTALRDAWGKGVAILLSGLIFAAVHPGMPGSLLPLWTLGIALAMVYSWRKSLAACIALHMTFNTLAFVAQLYQK